MFSEVHFKNEGESGLLDDFAIAARLSFSMEYFTDFTLFEPQNREN